MNALHRPVRGDTSPRSSALLAFFVAAALAAALCGCYSNTGSATAVGDITALPEISDAADNLCVKVYYSMTGARVWTAKDSLVKITYANDYTNRYCGVIETRGAQRLAVEIEPLADGATDAATPAAATRPLSDGATDAATPAAATRPLSDGATDAQAEGSAVPAAESPAAPAPSGATSPDLQP